MYAFVIYTNIDNNLVGFELEGIIDELEIKNITKSKPDFKVGCEVYWDDEPNINERLNLL